MLQQLVFLRLRLFLSLAAFSATNDVHDFNFESDKKQLMTSRVIMLVVGILALVIAYMDLAVLRVISWFAASAVASSWTVVGFGSVWWKKMNARGAIWSMGFGFLTCMLLTIANRFGWISIPMWLHPFYFAIAVAFIGAWLGSKGGELSKAQIKFIEEMHTMPESERSLELVKRTKRYGYTLITSGVALSTFLVFWWALPFNA